MAESEITDEQLVSLSKDGNLSAFNSLVERYDGPVFNLCYRLLGHRQSAEDAAQEAFISAYRAITRFGQGSVRSWLLRIAANECKDELRRRNRKDRSISLDAPEDDGEPAIDPPDRSDGPEAEVEWAELGERLHDALDTLPFDQRQAILLVDYFDMRYEEAAEATGASVGTVKSRIHRGREKLREHIRRHPELFADYRRLD